VRLRRPSLPISVVTGTRAGFARDLLKTNERRGAEVVAKRRSAMADGKTRCTESVCRLDAESHSAAVPLNQTAP